MKLVEYKKAIYADVSEKLYLTRISIVINYTICEVFLPMSMKPLVYKTTYILTHRKSCTHRVLSLYLLRFPKISNCKTSAGTLIN